MTSLLFILRHGQAEMFSPDGDFARKLTPRGMEDCRQAGSLFRERNWAPDLVLCSSAMRTRMSLDAFAESYQGDMPLVDYLDEIYEASIDTIWSCLARANAKANNILLIGHNPGLSMLTDLLAQDDLETKNLFPSLAPASLAVLDCGENHQHFAPNQANVVDLVHPHL